GRHRGTHHGEGGVRAGADPGALRARHDVHRRRARDRGDLRARLRARGRRSSGFPGPEALSAARKRLVARTLSPVVPANSLPSVARTWGHSRCARRAFAALPRQRQGARKPRGPSAPAWPSAESTLEQPTWASQREPTQARTRPVTPSSYWPTGRPTSG